MVALLGDISVDVNPTPNSLEAESAQLPNLFLSSSREGGQKLLRICETVHKLWPPSAEEQRIQETCVSGQSHSVGKVLQGKKKEKENDPCLSPPELSKQLYILFRDHTQSGWQEQAQQFQS